jgi:DNA gyrase inhibitor GyrI
MRFYEWLMIFVLLAAAGIVLFLHYMGIFTSINITERQIGPYTYAYEEFVGPYQNTVPVFVRVNNFLSAQNVTAGNGIGVYFDNPAQVPAYKLRSNCGAVIDETDTVKLSAVPLQQLKIGSIEQMNCAAAEFPIKNFLSYMFAPMKVYPAISKYMADKGYKPRESYEIYDVPDKKIVIAVPISQ